MNREATNNSLREYHLKNNNFFINSVSRKFAITSVISMIFLYASSMIDTVLVGIFLGETGLSAMSLVSPVYLIFYTVGATIGIGANIASSRELGRGNQKEYKRIFTCATVMLLVLSGLLTFLGIVFINPISRLLCGGNSDNFPLVKQYLINYLPGGAFTLLAYIPLYFLKNEGKPKVSSFLFSLSAVINVGLSWLFLSPLFNMGIGGAGLATSISMGIITLFGYLYIAFKLKNLRFIKKSFNKKTVKSLIFAGIPNGISNLLESAQIFMINMLLILVGSGTLLSCYTVVRNIMGIQTSIIIGISSSLLPLIGVFFGERDYTNEREVMKLAERIGVFVMLPLIVIICLIPTFLFGLFGVTDSQIIAEGRKALPLACMGLLAAYLNSLYTNYLTAINRETFATVMIALKTFGLVAFYAIPLGFLFNSYGIWISFSLAEITTLVVYLTAVFFIRKKSPELDSYLLSSNYDSESDISFTVKCNVDAVVDASMNCSEYCENHGVDRKKCMKISLAIEELLTFLINNCFSDKENGYIDVRVCKIEDEVMLRFRYIGEIFDLVSFYNDNSSNEDLSEDLLGLQIMFASASMVNFRQILGANNLVVIF